MLNLLNLAAFLVNLGITYGSLTGAFGPTNSSLSAKYHTLITPSGFAFSIWGPIFIWEGVFAVAQMFPSYRGSMLVKTITPWWLSACLFQCAWTFLRAGDHDWGHDLHGRHPDLALGGLFPVGFS